MQLKSYLQFVTTLVTIMFTITAAEYAQGPARQKRASLAGNYGKLPLSFEENRGQSDPQVKFVSRGNGYSLFLTDSAAVLALTKGSPAKSMPGPLATTGMRTAAAAKLAKTDLVRMELVGASKSIKVSGAERLPGTANYFIGNDPAKWHSSVPTYAKVRYDGVYPGVDLVYYGNQSQLEYDFVVAPEADTRGIRLHFAGAKKLKLDSNGDLEVIARNGQVAFHKPVVYQEIEGKRRSVEGSFELQAKSSINFKLGTYDHSRAIVIDPTLAYSTYLSGDGTDIPFGVAVDAEGSAYVAGSTTSSDFPVKGALQSTNLACPKNNYKILN